MLKRAHSLVRLAGSVAAAIVCTSLVAAPPIGDGDLKCDFQKDRRQCVLAWNLTANPRAFYQVQRYDVLSQGWQFFGRRYQSPYGSTDAAVPGGHLYRMMACDDLRQKKNCVGSKVQWALLIPGRSEDIPEVVTGSSGGKMLVSKSDDLALQTDQYNVYLIANLLDDIEDLAAMPPMTQPRLMPDAPLFDGDIVDEEQMEASIYHNYETRRRMAGASAMQSGSSP